MIYRFEQFELDTTAGELRADGVPVAIEPKVFALLQLLVENPNALLHKEELLAKLWQGRVVSDAAISSCIKAARQALGDDGRTQRFIKTVHGRGIRSQIPLVQEPAELEPRTIAIPGQHSSAFETVSDRVVQRPSIAVLPFRPVGDIGRYAAFAEAIPQELITALARLRWLFVIARGSSFRFGSADADVHEVGRALNVRYCLTGSIEVSGKNLVIGVELVETHDAGVVWAERFSGPIKDVQRLRREIVAGVISVTEIQISSHEANLARLNGTDQLDAWAAYHLGLQHMYRFNKADNRTAQEYFERAVAIDPEFCRANAGLSFTHFQNAFLRYVPDIEQEVAAAKRSAELSMKLDDLDPFANLTMGRSLWLDGRLEECLTWLSRATTLAPSYAQSIYAQALTETLSGRGEDGEAHAESAMALSPMDPLMYAMLGTRSLSHTVRGDFAEAATWAEKAGVSPGAHVMVSVIAAFTQSLNGDRRRAGYWTQRVRERFPEFTQQHFFSSFPFSDPDCRELISAEMTKLDF